MMNASRAFGFRQPWIEISDAAQRQPGQVGDFVSACAGDGDRQRADGVGLVDNDQHRPVLREVFEDRPQFGLIVR